MATAKFIDNADFEQSISAIIKQRKDVVARALLAGAAVIANEMRRRLKNVLSKKSSGDMLDSLGFTPVKRRYDGSADTHIGFDGYDRKGVPNQLKARVLENGAEFGNGAKRRAHPFARPAVKAAREKAYLAMQTSVQADIDKAWNP